MKRVIDVHTHVYLPSFMKLLRARTQVPRVFTREGLGDRLVILPNEDIDPSTSLGRPIGNEYYDRNTKLQFMDMHGIDVSVLSLANPWLDFLEPKEAESVATVLNNELQEWCENESRFYGFGVLPTHSVQGSVAEIERLSKHSKLRGFIMGTHGLGKGLDDPELEPVFVAAEKHGQMIFLHPHYGLPSNVFGDRENGHVLPLALGFPFETTIAVSRMILSGIFDRLPGLKMLLAHSGGTLPFLAGRLDSCVEHDAHVQHRLQKKPSEYLKNLYYDAVAYHAPGLQCAIDLVGKDRFMFGTDNPFFPPLQGSGVWESVETNRRAIHKVSQSKEDRDNILGGNAARILNLK
ncbi:hypothetical protein EDD86DRAFT_81259 [Gorgonomyces haynaldii]|nr:hypothetical protein EDD86DRAFT_81259 [Gorgonomyces haynaldii]